eukprot:Rmarinus@m.1570
MAAHKTVEHPRAFFPSWRISDPGVPREKRIPPSLLHNPSVSNGDDKRRLVTSNIAKDAPINRFWEEKGFSSPQKNKPGCRSASLQDPSAAQQHLQRNLEDCPTEGVVLGYQSFYDRLRDVEELVPSPFPRDTCVKIADELSGKALQIMHLAQRFDQTQDGTICLSHAVHVLKQTGLSLPPAVTERLVHHLCRAEMDDTVRELEWVNYEAMCRGVEDMCRQYSDEVPEGPESPQESPLHLLCHIDDEGWRTLRSLQDALRDRHDTLVRLAVQEWDRQRSGMMTDEEIIDIVRRMGRTYTRVQENRLRQIFEAYRKHAGCTLLSGINYNNLYHWLLAIPC